MPLNILLLRIFDEFESVGNTVTEFSDSILDLNTKIKEIDDNVINLKKLNEKIDTDVKSVIK